MPLRMLMPLIEPVFFTKYDLSKNTIQLNRMFQLIFMIGNVIALYFVSIFLPFGKEILRLLFNKDYVMEAYWPFIMFSLFLLMHSIPFGLTSKALLKPKILVIGNNTAVIINLVLGFILALKYGALGMAAATSFSALIKQTIFGLYLKKHIQLKIPWQQILNSFACFAFVVVLSYSLNGALNLNFVFSIVIGTVVYGLLVHYLAVFTDEQKDIMIKLMPTRIIQLVRPLAFKSWKPKWTCSF